MKIADLDNFAISKKTSVCIRNVLRTTTVQELLLVTCRQGDARKLIVFRVAIATRVWTVLAINAWLRHRRVPDQCATTTLIVASWPTLYVVLAINVSLSRVTLIRTARDFYGVAIKTSSYASSEIQWPCSFSDCLRFLNIYIYLCYKVILII